MNRARHAPLLHPLAPVFERAVDSLSAARSPDTTRHYRGTVRNFLSYLADHYHQVNCLRQLRREPHILGWMSRLHSQAPPLTTESYINQLIALRSLCNELAWTEQLPELAHLIRREDIPRVLTGCHGRSQPSKMSSCSRSSSAATTSGAMPFC